MNSCGCFDPAVFGHVANPSVITRAWQCPGGVMSGVCSDHLYQRCACATCGERRALAAQAPRMARAGAVPF